MAAQPVAAFLRQARPFELAHDGFAVSQQTRQLSDLPEKRLRVEGILTVLAVIRLANDLVHFQLSAGAVFGQFGDPSQGKRDGK